MIRFLLLLMLLHFANLTFACQPVFSAWELNASEEDLTLRRLEQAELVAIVEATSVLINESQYSFSASLTVVELFKGDSELLELMNVPLCCICVLHYEAGERYLVYANSDQHQGWYIDAYHGSARLGEVAPITLSILRNE